MQECDKFAKAFKDPEFIKMFEEYAKEVSDPKVKAETDAYLRQLEMEGRIEEVYGKGAQLIMPEPAFVLKTSNKPDGVKVFINVCSSDKIDKASLKEATSADGRKGKHLDMPLCLGPRKDGKDKNGEPCLVWDFVVHPETLAMAATTAAIREAMIVNAMEKIESSSKGVILDRGSKSPKINGNYKATEGCPKPHSLALRGEGASSVEGRIKPLDQSQTPPTSQAASASQQEASSAASRSSFAFPSAAPKSKPKASNPPIEDPTHAGFIHEGGEKTPQWEIVHRGQVDLGEAWGDAGRSITLNNTHPKELVLRVTLPGVDSASVVDLDLSRSQVSIHVESKYKLKASLPYPVDSDRGRAKFDKAKSQLEVVMPVVAPPQPPRPSYAVAAQEHPLVEPLDPLAADEGQGEEEATASGKEATASSKEFPPIGEQEVKVEDPLAIKPEVEAAAALTENQKRWMEMHALSHPQSTPTPADSNQGATALEASAAAPPPSVAAPPPLPAIKPRLTALADELD